MKKNICARGVMIIVAGLLTFGFSSAPTSVQPDDDLEIPEWMSVDKEAKTVAIEIVAGKTNANNNWNFNGFTKGEATVVVPEGFTVTLTFKNNDANMVHSIGVGERKDEYPAMMENPTPVFEGALSLNPTDMVNATKPGTSEVLTFKVDKAGEYALICFIPAHATTGMWIGFNVSADGEVGLEKPQS